MVSQFCKKASRKLYALVRIFKYVETSKHEIFVIFFIISQFSYGSLIWMFHSRKMEQRVNKIHKRALRLIYSSNSKLTFKELLNQSKIVSIDQESIRALDTEILKAKLNISQEILKELIAFFQCKTLSSQNPIDTERNKKNYVLFDSESPPSLAPEICDLVHTVLKMKCHWKGLKTG